MLSEEVHSAHEDIGIWICGQGATSEVPSSRRLKVRVKALLKMFDSILRAIGSCLRILSRKANKIRFVFGKGHSSPSVENGF